MSPLRLDGFDPANPGTNTNPDTIRAMIEQMRIAQTQRLGNLKELDEKVRIAFTASGLFVTALGLASQELAEGANWLLLLGYFLALGATLLVGVLALRLVTVGDSPDLRGMWEDYATAPLATYQLALSKAMAMEAGRVDAGIRRKERLVGICLWSLFVQSVLLAILLARYVIG